MSSFFPLFFIFGFRFTWLSAYLAHATVLCHFALSFVSWLVLPLEFLFCQKTVFKHLNGCLNCFALNLSKSFFFDLIVFIVWIHFSIGCWYSSFISGALNPNNFKIFFHTAFTKTYISSACWVLSQFFFHLLTFIAFLPNIWSLIFKNLSLWKLLYVIWTRLPLSVDKYYVPRIKWFTTTFKLRIVLSTFLYVWLKVIRL